MFRAKTIIKLCLMLLSVELVLCDWKPSNKVRETLCNTAECKARGDDYKKNLNVKVDPCNDFFTFTCGNWLTNHPAPKYASQWNINYELNIEILNIIRKILESHNFNLDEDKFRRLKLVYEYCIKIPEYPIKEAKDIAKEITKIGRVPATRLWDIHSKYLRLSGESALFRIKILTNPVSHDLPLLMFMEPHSAYGSIYHESGWKPQEKQSYTDFLFRMMKSLKLKDSDAAIKQRIEKVFEFREKFNRIIRQNRVKNPDGFNLFAVQELDTLYSPTLRQRTSTQKLLWKDVVEALLPHISTDKWLTRNIVAIRQKQYLLDLLDLFKSTSEEVLASHLEIYFVETHLKFDEKMYRLLEGTSVEPHNFLSYIGLDGYPRWHKCIDELNAKKIFEKLLYQKWFPKDYPNIIRAMNSRIKSAIVEQMENSVWLDQPTREKTAQKINTVQEWIGFPPWIDGSQAAPVEKNSDDILTAQASLTIATNVLYVHSPFLLSPVFNATMPDVYNYAGMGFTLGHELYHVIDDCGQYDHKSSKVVWWEQDMRYECIRRKYQFIIEYDKITNRELQNRYNIGLRSDTSASVLENVPDAMGLQAAYNAYKKLELEKKSVCQTLPNFEKYSCDQMFYIAFANTFCGFNNRKSAERRIRGKTTHSLGSIRVNGGVAQMKSFGTAFGCPVGSLMNPEQKLDLWK